MSIFLANELGLFGIYLYLVFIYMALCTLGVHIVTETFFSMRVGPVYAKSTAGVCQDKERTRYGIIPLTHRSE